MDHPLVEWLATLPPSLKIRGQEGKYLLKKAMEPYLPAEDPVPPEDGIRGAARALVPRAAAAARARRAAGRAARRDRLVRAARISSISSSTHESGRRDYSAPLWTLLMFDAFLRNVVDQSDHGAGTDWPRKHSHAHPARPRPLAAAAQRLRVPHARDPARAAGARVGDAAAHDAAPREGARRTIEDVDGWHFHRTPPGGTPASRVPGVGYLREMRATARRIEEVARDVRRRHPPCAFAGAECVAGAARGPQARHSRRLRGARALGGRGGRPRHDHAKAACAIARRARSRPTRSAARATSRPSARDCAATSPARGIPAERVTVIPNAVDAREFRFGAAPDPALAAKLGLDGATVIGFAGSFYAYEGLDLLLDAAALLVPQRPDLRVLLVGGGPQEEALKAQAIRRVARRSRRLHGPRAARGRAALLRPDRRPRLSAASRCGSPSSSRR